MLWTVLSWLETKQIFLKSIKLATLKTNRSLEKRKKDNRSFMAIIVIISFKSAILPSFKSSSNHSEINRVNVISFLGNWSCFWSIKTVRFVTSGLNNRNVTLTHSEKGSQIAAGWAQSNKSIRKILTFWYKAILKGLLPIIRAKAINVHQWLLHGNIIRYEDACNAY